MIFGKKSNIIYLPLFRQVNNLIIALYIKSLFLLLYCLTLACFVFFLIFPPFIALSYTGCDSPLGQAYDCPSSVYPSVHSYDSLSNHALSVHGSHQNNDGAQIIELRGWIHPENKDIPLCVNGNYAYDKCINNNEPITPDLSYNLQLDPVWLEQNGMDINEIVRVGNLLMQSGGNNYATSGNATIKIELMSWHPNEFIGLWPFNSPLYIPPPTGWNFKINSSKFGSTYWPWNPLYPSNVDPTSNPNAYLKDGEYVRVVGSIVSDFPHENVWKYPRPTIPTDPERISIHHDPLNPARWSEIHPPDRIEIIPAPTDQYGLNHTETVRCVAAVAENGLFEGDWNSWFDRIDAPVKPDPLAKLKYIEEIDKNGNTNERSITNKDIIIYPAYNQLQVSGTIQAENHYGAWGKFKACYRFFWEPGPPQIILKITPENNTAGIPTLITVNAEDIHTHQPINGTVFIDNREVCHTNVPFIYTFGSGSSYSIIKVIAPGYVDAYTSHKVNRPLNVLSSLNSIEINNPVQVTVYANDPINQLPVNGDVMVYTQIGPKKIGDTNVPIDYTFRSYFGDSDFYQYPYVWVVASGYDDKIVPIEFTGPLPHVHPSHNPPHPPPDPIPSCLRPTDNQC
jgi:hypothetical protein